jgi:hypothetical protein
VGIETQWRLRQVFLVFLVQQVRLLFLISRSHQEISVITHDCLGHASTEEEANDVREAMAMSKGDKEVNLEHSPAPRNEIDQQRRRIIIDESLLISACRWNPEASVASRTGGSSFSEGESISRRGQLPRLRIRQVGERLRQWREDKAIRKENPTRVIICNGKRLSIGLNLYNALREIPSSNGQLWWIDAICIDQGNTTERGEQVDLMADIYGNAEEVVVWLGKSSPITEKAASFLAFLPPFTVHNDSERRGDSNQSAARESMLQDPNSALQRYMTKWMALLLIFRRHWFRRAWVLQEAILAKEITFRLGHYVLSQEALIRGMEWLEYILKRQTLVPWFSNNMSINRMRMTRDSIYILNTRDRFRGGSGWELEDYIEAVRGRDSTDKRDLAFAGFSLIRRSSPEATALSTRILKADYTKSIAQVYQEIAEILLKERIGLGMLSLVEDDSDKESRIYPSWVPDLAEKLRPSPFWTIGGDAFRTFQCSDDARYYSVNGLTLNIQGIEWDEIHTVGEDAGDHLDLGYNFMHARGGILDLLSSLGRNYTPTGEATMTALWRTLVADLYQGQHPAPSFLSSSFFRWFFLMTLVQTETFTHAQKSIFMLRVLFRGYWRHCKISPDSISVVAINMEEIYKMHESKEYPFRQALTDIFDVSFENSPVSFSTATESSGDNNGETWQFPAPFDFLNLESLASDNRGIEQPETASENSNDNTRETEPPVSGVSLEDLATDEYIKYSPTSAEGSFGEIVPDSVAEMRTFDDIAQKIEPFRTAFDNAYGGRRIFLTKKGYLGLGPASIRADDTIMLVEGSYVPSIFRKAVRTRNDSMDSIESLERWYSQVRSAMESQTDLPEPQSRRHSFDSDIWGRKARPRAGETCWRLVGEAYVHGIMHGEALLDKSLSTETIRVI